ncbi:MAG TPA: DUF4398 domain-containing protein [Steroidobacteraceae bacterium]|nr:DUF4398 domain-containing protein [Steroidobacteraceae bacterium]
MNKQLSRSTLGATACAAIAIALGACASTPVPNEKIAVAKESVQRAEHSGAAELAPVEMAAAREELSRAEKAAIDGNAQPATLLAERATVDAELAEAMTRQQRSHKAAMEFDANMQALSTETIRSTQPTQ